MAASMSCASCLYAKQSLRLSHRLIARTLHGGVSHRQTLSNSSTDLSRRDQTVTQGSVLPPDIEKDKIIIPKKKKRTPTSILKALASTVERDSNAPLYKYVDDPFFIPNSMQTKKVFSLAKASGQKAAKYVIETYPHLFEKAYAEPSVKAYMPSKKFVYLDDCEEGLLERIDARKVTDAYESYQKIRETGKNIEQSTYNSLLNLLCVYNSEDPAPSLMPDEQYYLRDVSDSQQRLPEWKMDSPAEMVFSDMDVKTAEAYNAIIRGRGKFRSQDGAFELYLEAINKDIPVEVNTYNAVICSLAFLPFEKLRNFLSGSGSVLQAVQIILEHMHDNGVQPNLGTFNSILFMISRKARFLRHEAKGFSLQLLNEMKKCDIEPSLTTWSYIIKTFYLENSTKHNILYEIVKYIEDNEISFQYQEPTDFQFFVGAMAKCSDEHLNDIDLAHRVHKILMKNDVNLLGNTSYDGVYYNMYMKLMCTFEDIHTIMKFYDDLIPHVWLPNLNTIMEMLDAIDLNDGHQFLPRMWEDFSIFNFQDKEDIMQKFLSCMAKRKQEPQLQEHFLKMIITTKEQLSETDNFRQRQRKLKLTGPMLGDMITISLNSDNFDLAREYFMMYITKRHETQGFPSEASLEMLTKKCIEQGKVEEALESLSLMSDLVYPKTKSLVEELDSSAELTESQREKIEAL